MTNLFGAVVDDNMLDGKARYHGKPKTQEDRAREAMRVEHGSNYDEARDYVVNMKENYGAGASTLCLVFNGTGDTLRYVIDHNYYDGHIFPDTPYPAEIGNGQWASFLHIHGNGPSGSVAAVIYDGKQKDGLDRNFTLAWSTPWNHSFTNKAYCQMNGVEDTFDWDDIYDRTNTSGYIARVNEDDMQIQVSTTTATSPMFTAVLSTPYDP